MTLLIALWNVAVASMPWFYLIFAYLTQFDAILQLTFSGHHIAKKNHIWCHLFNPHW